MIVDLNDKDFMRRNIDAFYGYISRIVLWNSVCSNPTSTEEQAYETQVSVTLEEIKETINGYLKNDRAEYVDGVCDVVVTAGYLAYMNKDTSMDIDLDHVVFDREQDILNFGVKVEMTPEDVKLVDVFWIFLKAMELIDEKYLHEYMNAVLDSNDTKILKFPYPYDGQQIKDVLVSELDYVAKKYAGEFTGIVPVQYENDVNQSQYYVFRANLGAGKILKPSQYKLPKDFLSEWDKL